MHYPLHPQVEAFSTEIGEELPYPVLQPHQTHTCNVRIITSPDTQRCELQDVDALITSLPDFAIGVRTADCVPVLLYDPTHQVCAAIHAGWRGTVGRITQATISLMQQHFGTRSSDLFAAIGPSIGPDSFQVGEEVVEEFRSADFPMHLIHSYRGERSTEVITGDDGIERKSMEGGHHLDLWAANHWLLTECGVPLNQIQVAGICTYENAHRFYSARHDGNLKTRRIINAIKVTPLTSSRWPR